jgi:undecaprenyl-diphosphatase
MSARVASVAAGAAFLGLLGLVAFGWPPMREWDRALSEQARVAGREHPDVIATLRILTDAAATIPFLAAGVALTVGFIIIREYGSAKRAALVTALVPAIWGLLHAVLSRPRPVDGFVTVASSGFPSGHTGHATAFGLLVVTLVARRLGSGGRIPILLAAVVFALFMGVTRVVLLAH